MRQSDKVRSYSCILSLLIDVMLVTDENNKTIIIVITNVKGIAVTVFKVCYVLVDALQYTYSSSSFSSSPRFSVNVDIIARMS